MTETIETDILIIGGGVAGPALACGLNQSGLRVVLLEKSDKPLDTSRGDHLQPKTCEILDEWGVLDLFMAAGAEKRDGAVWRRDDGSVIRKTGSSHLPIPHPYFLYLNHEHISTCLLDGAGRNPNFTLMRPITNWRLGEAHQSGTDIVVTDGNGEEVTIRTRLLVGADGRVSKVRDVFDLPRQEHAYERPIVALFAPRIEDNPGNDVNAYISERGMVSLIPRTGGWCKVGVSVDRSAIKAWTKSDVKTRSELLAERVPKLAGLQTEFGGLYPPLMVHTDRWASGNVVLIGDACHAMHPGLSQGMNVAIRSIHRLVAHLPAPGDFGELGAIEASLAAYEQATRPAIDTALERNHARGVEMDQFNADTMPAFLADLESIVDDPDAHYSYCMMAAGYGS